MLSEVVCQNIANDTLRILTFIAEVFIGVKKQTGKQITHQKLLL